MNELIFSVTAGDCDFIFQRGRGNGGQKKNKTNSACICTHRASGAQGYAEDTRSQQQNRRLAFLRMAESEKFKQWHKLELARRTGDELRLQEEVDRAMRRKNLRVEGKDEKGRWVELPKDEEARV